MDTWLVSLPLSLLIFIKDLFIFGCAGSLLLCVGFLYCGEWGLVFILLRGFIVVVASFVGEHRL